MAAYFGSTAKYLLIGIIVYLLFRALVWIFYRRGEMRVPVLHEAGMLILAFWVLALFSSSVSPALEFSIKPTFPGTDLIPLKGMLDLVSDEGFGALFWSAVKYIPIGFLVPFLFKRYRDYFKILVLGGGTALFIEIFQLFITTKGFRTDDVILAAAGLFIGYMIFCILHDYVGGLGKMATVKRSRHKSVPPVIRYEPEIMVLLMLAAVLIRGTQIQASAALEKKAEQQRIEEEEAAAALEAEEEAAAEAEEAEANKLKTADETLSLSLESGAVCVFSIDEEVILYESGSTTQVSPGDTAKLLTALTVLEYCELDETVTAGEEISLISSSAATASLKSGNYASVELFLGAMLVPSGSDAAYTLAAYTGGKILSDDDATTDEKITAFVEAMNTVADGLGVEDSYFETPDGDQSDSQYTTAQDMVRIAAAALENETISALCASYKYRALYDDGTDYTYRTTNSLINSSSEYYLEEATGLMAGSYGEEYSLIASADIDGETYIAVIMKGTDTGRYSDALAVFEALGAGAEASEEEVSEEETSEE